ncbi:DUF1385 domain-containing protein [Clostridium estertheticum]|uniref:DUF1385 domain-containing protein n=2 Tax=Clostridium estertheticum TaxID=238834 RepID=A0A1J0GCQ8_9CLOT|nr:DUF1385 domain-containing protein [Clostridium estertheticum]APC38768.1 hypothetical protein A7L45_01110 [Clostridium estertheticum subsp. estertheticum]MBU3074621.1 DUF1385 domain-containing protein [Clostridium estertheticum]MBU3164667.1 DUF1385 domain-containing protein [Clostridium estertheticum]MBU3171422.1 DUF1385 domain-containing protein [Clostridium estertheticum]MBU3185589.1 DUF1385 domain-containing protein [Clostridium estertheticum]
MAKNTSVGGQAVIEGVMMRGLAGIATAVRTEQGEIVVEKKSYTSYTKKNKLVGLPIIRGFISLIESLIIGIKTLNYSASFFEEEGEPSKLDKCIQKLFKEKSNDVVMGISLVISLALSVGLFFIVPTFVANLFSKLGTNTMGMNIVEGIIRVLIFLLYVYLIGKMEDIKRVYEYHGAEHKTIFCYENEVELTPENAAKFGRLHPRCGTNFLFLVMIVSIIVFSLTGWNSIGERIMYRIILLPFISGISYEIIKWMGKSKSNLATILSYPGLKLQNLTTREPDLSQLEVAIRALKVAEGIID